MDQVPVKTGWQIQEVYAADIQAIASFYEQLKVKDRDRVLPESFGLPFLIALNEGKIAGFASLVPDSNGEICYKCYNDLFIPYFSESEWLQQLAVAFARQRQLFADAGHLNSGIRKLLRWISQS
ncbi:MAG: hypothetical protein EOP54_01135 [Sphingobacteriales bacterium]|nr:MAG: hypothetical protein EOP54_01135 [Sphingobacteriales bacterium]